MSGQKRKAAETKDSKPRTAPNSAKKFKPSRKTDDETSERKLPTSSILLEEEKTFPRGRGAGLTPLEKKQIQLRADSDVLFEETGQKPPARQHHDNDSSDEGELEPEMPATKRHPKSKHELRRENNRKRELKLDEKTERPKPKGLKQGDVVDGRIVKVDADEYDRYLTLELLNHRKGVVSVTAVSTQLTQKLQSLLGDEDDEKENEKDEADLKKYFHRGQDIRAVVTKVIEASHDTSGQPTKGSIQLSVDPRQVNKVVLKNTLTENTRLNATVKSVEDHGLVMDLGSGEKSLDAFMPGDGIPKGRKLTHMKVGMVLLCIVTSAGGKVIKLTANHPDLAGSAQQQSLGLKNAAFTNPVDEDLKSLDSLLPGCCTKARITSVKDTQLNVLLADGVQGRIDVSEAFQTLEDVKDRKHPLNSFKQKQIIPVRVLGIHDARNHRFLPISHRGGHVPVFELSARLGKDASIMSFDQLKEGESCVATVNNSSGSNLWVNLSPNVRGRIERMDLPEDVSDLSVRYPIGSVLKVWVKKMDLANNRLDLSTRQGGSAPVDVKLEDVSQGMILAGRVTKVEDNRLFVQLSPSVSGVVPLTDISDDFDETNPHKHQKNEMIRVFIVDVDRPNKRITMSARPSKVLSSSLPVKDKHVTDVGQLKRHAVVRGFVQKVDDIGLFVTIGPGVKALVPVAELSDDYLKDWKPQFQVDKLVTGRIIELDEKTKRVHLSIKKSVIEFGYKPVLKFQDLKKHRVVTGKVRAVEEYGVFIVIDNSRNLSGLCHRSQIADRKIEDAKGLFDVGESVTAVIAEVDKKKDRISFSLKSSAFEHPKAKKGLKALGKESPVADKKKLDEADDVDMSDSDAGVDLPLDGIDDELDDDSDAGVDLPLGADGNLQMPLKPRKPTNDNSDDGLDAGGFDWNPVARKRSPSTMSDALSETEQPKKKRKKRAEPTIDETDKLARYGPRTSADYERLLFSDGDDPALWMRYMDFYLRAGDVATARTIAERATRSISLTRDQEKLEVWTAWMNLELGFGEDIGDVSDEAVNADTTGALNFLRDVPLSANVKGVFANACKVHDRALLAERLTKSCRNFKLLDAASALYERMSHDKAFTADPAFWIRYATFLMRDADPLRPQDARALVSRATQVLSEREHARLLMEFARLEFKLRPGGERGGAGDPERGRTLFTELLSVHPKRFDFWDVWLSLEDSLLQVVNEKDAQAKEEQEDRIRDLFERQTGEGNVRMKKKRAQTVFAQWLKFEQQCGKGRSEMDRAKRVDRVKARERRHEEQRLKREQEKAEKEKE